MMKLWGLLSILLALGANASDGAPNGRNSDPGAGDDDPFPLLCADFSGSWKSDGGERYVINQRRCEYLRMQMFFGSESEVMTLIPDNKIRGDSHMYTRHRWNSPKHGTVLESNRTFMIDSQTRVREVVMFERITLNLLLQTTYRTIDCPTAPAQAPRHEYEQQMFRRMGTVKPGQDLLKLPKRRHRIEF